MASEPKRPIPAATFGRNFGRYKDQAIADGVVEISHHGRLVGAYLSKDEYIAFRNLKEKLDVAQNSTDGIECGGI